MNSSPLNILVIEDDEDTCRNLRDILELDQISVQMALTAADAMPRLRRSEIDVILLDRKLPDATAEELLPKLRAAVPDAEVIIVTGHADLDSAIAALRLGATDYLLKPINPEALRASLRRLAERRRMARRLVEAERLAAIGEAMAGLTHESHNALARCHANLRRLARQLKDRPDLLELIDASLVAHQDVERLFENVRQYAAPLRLQHERTDVRALLFEAWEKLDAERQGRAARIHLPPTGGDLECEVDPFLMRNAFRNLLENSLAACEDPVEIDVRIDSLEQDGSTFVQVAIHDNGPGFPPETAARAFEAFHTTKTHGTGLGLAIVKRTIEEHGGSVAIGSSSGRGAEIILNIPRTHA